MKSITIVIPNYNGMKYLEGCLDSLQDQTDRDFEVLMIDNGSTDGSVEWVRTNYPKVKIRAYHRNTGFCHAVNAGIRLSCSEYVLLLNNDVVCDRNMVFALHRAMLEKPNAFCCCAKLVQMSDPGKIDDAGDFYCALGWAFARGKGQSSDLYNREEKVFACCAAAAIYRRSMLEMSGLFDERHFAYLEDIDIGYRALRMGYENWYIPGALVYHAGSATSGSTHNEFKVRLAARNSIWLVKKNMPTWQILLNLPFLTAGCGLKWVYFLRKGLGRPYLEGLTKGLRSQGSFEGVCDNNLPRYLKIQAQLYYGIYLRFFS